MRLLLLVSILGATAIWPSATEAAEPSDRLVKIVYDGTTKMTVKRSGQGRIIDRSGDQREVIGFRLRAAALASLKRRIAGARVRQLARRYDLDSEYPITCGPAPKVINTRGRTIRIAYGVFDLPPGLKRLVKRLLATMDRFDPLDGAQASQRCTTGGSRS